MKTSKERPPKDDYVLHVSISTCAPAQFPSSRSVTAIKQARDLCGGRGFSNWELVISIREGKYAINHILNYHCACLIPCLAPVTQAYNSCPRGLIVLFIIWQQIAKMEI